MARLVKKARKKAPYESKRSRKPQVATEPVSIISTEELISHFWRFGRTNGSQISSALRFLPDGKIQGASHPNETSWQLRPDALEIRSASGEITTTFDRWETISGVPSLLGNFVKSQTVHLLTKGAEIPEVTI